MIDKKEIYKIAKLAKIDIKHDELETYSSQISKILEYIEELNNVDTSSMNEFSGSMLNDHQNLRDDVPTKSLSRDEVVGLAPDTDGVYFKVPKVIKKEEE